MSAPDEREVIRIGVSSCLLGNPVRYDGGHKRSRFVTDQLGAFVEFVPVCPELEVGMGVPRPTLRLELAGEDVRMVEPRSGHDHTTAMRRFSRRRVRALRELDLCGYVLKKDSPSCGMFRVKVYGHAGGARREGRGLFAAALLEALPELPAEEEGRLEDAVLRENFVERVFAYRRVRDLFAGRWRVGDLVAFHAAHKLQLLAHCPETYRSLGKQVAEAKTRPRTEVRDRYRADFMAGLARKATRGRHTNALQHMAGFVKKRIDDGARAELAGVIDDYRRGLLPLVVPITLLRHHARGLEIAYLLQQTYLSPHPKELMLRNHV